MQLKLNVLEKQSNRRNCTKHQVVDLGADGECRQLIQLKHWHGGGLGLLPSERTVYLLCGAEVMAGVALGCARWTFRSRGVLVSPQPPQERPDTNTHNCGQPCWRKRKSNGTGCRRGW